MRLRTANTRRRRMLLQQRRYATMTGLRSGRLFFSPLKISAEDLSVLRLKARLDQQVAMAFYGGPAWLRPIMPDYRGVFLGDCG